MSYKIIAKMKLNNNMEFRHSLDIFFFHFRGKNAPKITWQSLSILLLIFFFLFCFFSQLPRSVLSFVTVK